MLILFLCSRKTIPFFFFLSCEKWIKWPWESWRSNATSNHIQSYTHKFNFRAIYCFAVHLISTVKKNVGNKKITFSIMLFKYVCVTQRSMGDKMFSWWQRYFLFLSLRYFLEWNVDRIFPFNLITTKKLLALSAIVMNC